MSSVQLTDDDVGKRVVISGGGDRIGVVQRVADGTAYVDPDPDVFDAIQAELGWEDDDGDTYTLDESDVGEVTAEEVRLT